MSVVEFIFTKAEEVSNFTKDRLYLVVSLGILKMVSYTSIVKQPNKLTRPPNIPAYVSPRISAPEIQGYFIGNNLTQGDDSLLETLESVW